MLRIKLLKLLKSNVSDAAQGLMEETGARVYWQDANESSARIDTDRKKLAELNAMRNNHKSGQQFVAPLKKMKKLKLGILQVNHDKSEDIGDRFPDDAHRFRDLFDL